MAFNYPRHVAANFRLGEEEGGSLRSSFFFAAAFEGNVRNIATGHEGIAFAQKYSVDDSFTISCQ